MPRVRALVLLGLFLVNQAACTSWQLPKVTPQEYVAQHPDSVATVVIDGTPTYERSDRRQMRVTLRDGQRTSQGKVVLAGVRFSGDSVFGRDPRTGQSLAYGLREVTMFEVRGKDGMLTGMFVFVFAGLIAAGVAAYVAVDNWCLYCSVGDSPQ